jgi:hypothetical protein
VLLDGKSQSTPLKKNNHVKRLGLVKRAARLEQEKRSRKLEQLSEAAGSEGKKR